MRGMWRHRRRCGGRGRSPKPVIVGITHPIESFQPNPVKNPEAIQLDMAELEAFRLVDLEGLSQEEAGRRMGISRGTVWRLVQSARRKAAQALSEGRPIAIIPPDPQGMRPSMTDRKE